MCLFVASYEFAHLCVDVVSEEIIFSARRAQTHVERLVVHLHAAALNTRRTLHAGLCGKKRRKGGFAKLVK